MMRKNWRNLWKAGLCLGLSAAVTVGCGSNDLSGDSKNLTEQYIEKGSRQNMEKTKETKGAKEAKETKGENGETHETLLKKEFPEKYLDFCFHLLRETTAENTNVMISPVSVMAALSMTANGAAGNTLTQMQEVLYQGDSVSESNVQLKEFLDSLKSTDGVKMNLANSIWLKNEDAGIHVKEAFLEKNVQEFEAQIYESSFTDQTRKDINSWVEKNTDGMIPEMLSKMDPNAMMYLVNAAVFDGEWLTPYEKTQVQDAIFTRADGTEETVSMMYEDLFSYLEDEDTEGFIKDYKAGYQFVALLPQEGISIVDYIREFDSDKWKNLMDGCSDTLVETGLPKFSSDYDVKLNDMLTVMGMSDAFDEEKADFSDLGTADNGNICIGNVLHKTHIQVDELGTKAAASTVVEMKCESAMMIEDPKIVYLNRPFVYAIVESETMLPIFIGEMDGIKDIE